MKTVRKASTQKPARNLLHLDEQLCFALYSTGLALNNTRLILQGALPAATLALIVELLFELLAKLVIPAHLRR